MIKYLETSDFSFIVDLISNENSFSFEDYIFERKLPVKRLKLDNWSDLQESISDVEDIFGEIDLLPILADVRNLSFDKKVADYFINLKNLEKNVYLYSTEDRSLKADEKKLLKKVKIEFVNLKKKDESKALILAKNYLKKINLNINLTSLEKLVKQSLNYQEIIDILDLIELSSNPQEMQRELLTADELPIFMTSFNVDNISRDVPKWLHKIEESELQLHLSLIFGKLDKQKTPKAKTVKKNLIATDHKIKTISKTKPITWYKYFLWRALID